MRLREGGEVWVEYALGETQTEVIFNRLCAEGQREEEEEAREEEEEEEREEEEREK